MVSVWNAAFFTANGVIGITTNLFVIIVLAKSKEMMQHESSKFILNQSFLDAFSSLALILSYSNIVVGWGVTAEYISNSLGHEILCKVWNANLFQWSLIKGSTVNLVVVTLDRYMKICHPMWYKVHVGHKTIIALLISPWIIGPVYQMACFLAVSDVIDNKCKHHQWPSRAMATAIGAFSFVMEFAVPILVMLFCYISILHVIQRRWKKMDLYNAPSTSVSKLDSSQLDSSTTTVSNEPPSISNSQVSIIDVKTPGTTDRKDEQKNTQNRKTEKKIIKTLVIISLAFFTCWVCDQVMFFLVNIGVLNFRKIYDTPFYYFQLIMAYCNCWINPFIYISQFKTFRMAICKCTCK